MRLPSLFWAHKRSVVAESISPFWTLPVVLHDSKGEVREAASIPGHGIGSIFRDKSMPYLNIGLNIHPKGVIGVRGILVDHVGVFLGT